MSAPDDKRSLSDWQSAISSEALAVISADVQKRAKAAIDWYDKAADPKKIISQLLRLLAMFLGLLGGLCPLLPDAIIGLYPWLSKDWGYGLFALAGGCTRHSAFHHLG